MKVVDAHADLMEKAVVEQLAKYPSRMLDKPIETMSYREKVNQLARLRAREVKAESPNNSWF